MICPGYVQTHLNENASYSDEKKHDFHLNKSHGMSVEKFAERAIEGIYNKENEIIIDDAILPRLAVVFRNIWRDLVFAIIARKSKRPTSS